MNTTVSTNPQINAHQPTVNVPVANIPQGNKHTPPVASVSTDKSWSAVMSGPDLSHPPPYQSPQFQHEFPSLSAGDGAQQRTGTEVQYGPGPSLRPQTEGSWIQGGTRGTPEGQPKNNLAPQVAPPQLSAQAGLPSGQPIPQYPVFAPPFMCRGNNFIANGHGGNSTVTGGNVPPATMNGRNRAENRSARSVETDEVAHRPIIKEEDLNRMDDMRDMGWAANDDIDYNQKIAFSDDEGEKDIKRERPAMKEAEKTEISPDGEQKMWSVSRNTSGSQDVRTRIRSDDEEIAQRRKQHNAEVALVVSRAKQRKEEEEKRYQETKMMAQKKLQELEEKMKKREKESDEGQGTINPMSVPPQSITPSTIPVPDWEKEKDYKNKNEKPEFADEKPNKNLRETSDFRQMTQIETRNYPRKDNSRSFDREREPREQNGSSYAKFQSNLPPRFQKQQLRNNSNSSPQPPSSFHQNETRWMQNNQNPNKQSPPISVRKTRDMEREPRRSDEYNRGSHRNNYSDPNYKTDNRHKDDDINDNYRTTYDSYDYKRDDDKWEREREKSEKPESLDENLSNQSRLQTNDEFHEKREKYVRDDKISDRYERPQRPDSRDSRASRDSRHSRESIRDADSKEYFTSWNTESHLEVSFEDKRKEQAKEDRRQVPGPITKDRIEAEDLKSERRNLTQLKRGLVPEKKPETKQEEKKDDDGWDIRKTKDTSSDGSKGWGTSNSSSLTTESGTNDSNKFSDLKVENRNDDSDKKSEKLSYESKEKDDKRNQPSRIRPDNRNQGWSGGTVYRSSWSSKRGSIRGSRSGGLPRSASNKSTEWHGTDSDISADELSQSADSAKDDKLKQRSPKPLRKFDKDEKNKDKLEKPLERKTEKLSDNRKDYLPRGEPSRHGRGGGNFRGRGGSMSKRIDHYGPPPTKSPFSHSDDKDKKITEESSEDIEDKCKSGIINKWKDTTQTGMKMDQKIDEKFDKNRGRKLSENRRGKSKSKDGKSEDNDTTSENSDESASKDGKSRKLTTKLSPSNRMSSTQPRRNIPPPRLLNEKRNYLTGRNDIQSKPSNSSTMNRLQTSKKDENSICNAIADISLKNKDNVEESETVECEVEEKSSVHGDSDGFQEVKSKKNGKERQKIDEKILPKPNNKIEKDIKTERKGKPVSAQLSQQQIANIPPLMGTPVIPPPVMPQSSNKNARLNKLPPRFVKQRENNRLQKQQLQQTICDINDINKVNQNMNMYNVKDSSNAIASPISNAWEKPLSQLRNNMEQDPMLTIGIDNCKNIDQAQSPNQISNSEKVIFFIK